MPQCTVAIVAAVARMTLATAPSAASSAPAKTSPGAGAAGKKASAKSASSGGSGGGSGSEPPAAPDMAVDNTRFDPHECLAVAEALRVALGSHGVALSTTAAEPRSLAVVLTLSSRPSLIGISVALRLHVLMSVFLRFVRSGSGSSSRNLRTLLQSETGTNPISLAFSRACKMQSMGLLCFGVLRFVCRRAAAVPSARGGLPSQAAAGLAPGHHCQRSHRHAQQRSVSLLPIRLLSVQCSSCLARGGCVDPLIASVPPRCSLLLTALVLVGAGLDSLKDSSASSLALSL